MSRGSVTGLRLKEDEGGDGTILFLDCIHVGIWLWEKGSLDVSVFFLTTACESTVISK